MTKDDLKFNSNIKVDINSRENTFENPKSQEIGSQRSNSQSDNEEDFDQLRCISNVDQINLKKDKTSSIFEYKDRSASQINYDQMFAGSQIPEFDFNNQSGSANAS